MPTISWLFIGYFANVSWSVSMLAIFPLVVGLSVKYFQEIPRLFAHLATRTPPSRPAAEYAAFQAWLSLQFNRVAVPVVVLVLTLVLNGVYYYQILEREPDRSWITNGTLLRDQLGLPAGLSWVGAFSALIQVALIYWMGNLAWKSFVLAWGLQRYFNTERMDAPVEPLHVEGCCGLRRIGEVSTIFNGIMFLIGLYLSLKVIDKVAVQRAALASDIGNPVLLGCYAILVPALFFLPLGAAHRRMREGLDPREFPMVVAGGAGAIHACPIAEELGMPSLLVPAAASTLCAAGMLMSDLQHDFVRTYITPFSRIDRKRLLAAVAAMIADGEAQLEREGIERARIAHEVALDLRYLKQYHEVTLPVPREAVERGDARAIASAFHVEHNRLYGYDLAAEGTDLELINVRVRSLGLMDRPPVPPIEEGTRDPSAALKGRRRAYQPERMRFDEVPVYDAHRLRAGNVIPGPALVERTDTTIVVTSGFTATVDRHGSCLLERREARR